LSTISFLVSFSRTPSIYVTPSMSEAKFHTHTRQQKK
jgi:hypothetical protein